MRLAVLLLVALISASGLRAQMPTAPLSVFVTDRTGRTPVPGVEVTGPSGALVALGDAYGNITLQAATQDSTFLLLFAQGYEPDTLRAPFPATIALRAAGDAIDEVVVRGMQYGTLTPSRRDAVIDYDFAGRYLLVATARAGGRKPALKLVDFRGDTVAMTTLREEPISVITDCQGTPHVLFENRIQVVQSSGKKLELGRKYPAKSLPQLTACQLDINGTFYFKNLDPQQYRVSYLILPANDTVMRGMLTWGDDANIARAEEDERKVRLGALVAGNVGGGMQYMASLRNSLAMRYVDAPLLRARDTLVVPDFTRRRLVYFSLDGTLLGGVPLHCSYGPHMCINILQDASTGRVYVHRYHRAARQTVQELNLHTGALTGPVWALRQPFAQKVRIRDGRVYYMAQDHSALAARQLWVEALKD